MGKTSREAKQRALELEKKKRFRQSALTFGLVIGGIAVIALVAILSKLEKASSHNLTASLSDNGSLHVARSSLKEGFNYVDWGGDEKLILYRRSDGEVMAAFDTCEECYLRGSVHFTRDGDNMICSVCGTTSLASSLGAQSWGGCQPLKVPTAARQDTGNEIVVSSAAMDYIVSMLKLWDTGDQSMTFEAFEG